MHCDLKMMPQVQKFDICEWLWKAHADEAVPGKLHLFSLTQNKFILIQFVTFIRALHVAAILRHVNIKSLQRKIIYLCKVFTPLDSECIFLYKVFVLPRLRMALVKAETCSTHVQVPNWIKINLCCVKLNKCSLFSNKQNGMASIKIGIQSIF